jgi:anti-sigma factor RsiW
MKNFRDIEQISAYLDGQLSPSESARLESRITSDPELASAFNDLRATRGILRKLPVRKAPRNFILTRQMVGLKPPLPRSYSFFRFSTAFATVLLMLTFAANLVVPNISFSAGAPAPAAQEAFGIGGGPSSAAMPAASEAPVATEAPAAAIEAPAAPVMEMTATPTVEFLPTANADTTALEAPTAKEAATPSELLDQPPAQNFAETAPVPDEQSRFQNRALVPFVWQVALFILILLSGLAAFLLRRSAIQKWK